MQKDCQTVHVHPAWKDVRLGGVAAAWYQREISVPADWKGRRITVSAETLNSFADVHIDGNRVGEIRFPGGEVDVTAACRPGGRHLLSLRVLALPLKGVMLSYSDTNAAREVKGTVKRRGLCGDVFLAGVPRGARIADVKVDPSVRRGEVAFGAALRDLEADGTYMLRAEVSDGDRRVGDFRSRRFRADALADGRFSFSAKWRPEKLWDVHTPGHLHTIRLSLLDDGGKILDAFLPVRFGFRELWIDGRDFVLNGTRIHLSAVPLDNAQVGAAWASYAGARESLERLKEMGINFVYTHNYGCEPGSHLGFGPILRAADDTGMLVALSQPHFAHYDWKAPDADRENGYARHAAFYVRTAQNHPSVVFYAASHNATGYSEDMNPDMIDGVREGRGEWSRRNAEKALRAEAVVRRLDPSRIFYHHASGNLGAMHTSNFYPNFVPVQELTDWFAHWAAEGVKPVFLCEFGAPFTWDWSMYRGWYKGKRSFGSGKVPWEFCLAEWNAQFHGDGAFRISEMEKRNLRWEAKRFREGAVWHRWDYPHRLGSRDFDERYPILAGYVTHTWRAFRTWGVSAFSPWEHGILWRMRKGLDRNRREPLPADWGNLQRPDFSADYLRERYERRDLAYRREDWVATPAAEALLRNNRSLLTWIAGGEGRLTGKGHIYHPGETVGKQLVVINDSREVVKIEWAWSFDVPMPIKGGGKAVVTAGSQKRIPLKFELPVVVKPGAYELRATVAFSGGEVQKDAFVIHVLPRPAGPKPSARIALFDPREKTGKRLAGMGVTFKPVKTDADLAAFDVLVVGRNALTVDGPGPDLGRVRDGLRVLVFEQGADVLEKRLGFRVQSYGLRRVFPRVAGHPVLAGLEGEHLRDWRGDATLLPPRLKYALSRKYNDVPAVTWCGIEAPRLWRRGCRGSVASVLIEKPACGDFMPLVDGGYSLQYAPLLEYREGLGVVLFCQMDVTGRTESEPAAETLVRNLVRYVTAWKPAPGRKVVYAGEVAGRDHLASAGFSPVPYGKEKLSSRHVLVVGPGGGKGLAGDAAAVGAWLEAGGRVLAVGLDGAEAGAFLPYKVNTRKGEHIAAWFERPATGSLLAGIGPADVHNRDPRELPLVAGGATVVGNGVLAEAGDGRVVFCQLAPWKFVPGKGQVNVKRTWRRTSFLVARLLSNLGAFATTPLLDRFRAPAKGDGSEKRWLEGLYLDAPEAWDDPYRFFRW